MGTRDQLDRAFEREERRLQDAFEAGELSQAELRAELRDLERAYRDEEQDERNDWMERGGW